MLDFSCVGVRKKLTFLLSNLLLDFGELELSLLDQPLPGDGINNASPEQHFLDSRQLLLCVLESIQIQGL